MNFKCFICKHCFEANPQRRVLCPNCGQDLLEGSALPRRAFRTMYPHPSRPSGNAAVSGRRSHPSEKGREQPRPIIIQEEW